MIFTAEVGIVFAVVLAVCLLGFKNYVWFISVGYGFSISAVGLALPIVFAGRIEWATVLYCAVMLCYGLRLGGYILYRDKKTSYNKRMKGEVTEGSKVPMVAKVSMWIACALLYMMMMAPLIYRCVNGAPVNVWLIVGIVVSIAGVTIEMIADMQKTRAKKLNAARFCDSGLFKIVRCPNYMGELITWTGMILSAFGALQGVGQWIIAMLGYLGIVYVMFSGARRLEIRQDKNYGTDPVYVDYKKSTPIMIPFVPLYSVKKHKWLVG